ncbi:hypothetical protein BpHYR1_019530 [Brachionus plicatilis]|uniref:Uncharacterized protein n=1 Tax=Brachionus plicatilis TaxID=10195 RepID=A0A3M7PTX7_BRAPC|nr:hypothetical protein BpHYR1_019530 [Brachionus plicatilis]
MTLTGSFEIFKAEKSASSPTRPSSKEITETKISSVVNVKCFSRRKKTTKKGRLMVEKEIIVPVPS